MEGIKVKNRDYFMIEKLDNKIRTEEAKENYEYCAYILNFKKTLEEFLKLDPEQITNDDVEKFNHYLNSLDNHN